jgi:hypothetical protein
MNLQLEGGKIPGHEARNAILEAENKLSLRGGRKGRCDQTQWTALTVANNFRPLTWPGVACDRIRWTLVFAGSVRKRRLSLSSNVDLHLNRRHTLEGIHDLNAVIGVAIAGGQKTTLSQSGIGQSQRAKSFAVEFLTD